MTSSFTAAAGVDVITTSAEIPGLGSLAINSFLLHGREPLLVDTGTVAGSSKAYVRQSDCRPVVVIRSDGSRVRIMRCD